MTGTEPGIRRLCVVLATRKTGLLESACQSADRGRLLVQADPVDGTQIGVAQPGVDEVALLGGLIIAISRDILAAPHPAGHACLAADVGIVRVAEDGFSGPCLSRTSGWARNGASRATALHRASDRQGAPGFAVVMSAGLLADLVAEGVRDEGWQRLHAADPWVRYFDTRPSGHKLL